MTRYHCQIRCEGRTRR